MSEMRKSASLRSRIPVRRNRKFRQKRFGESDNIKRICGSAPTYKRRANRSSSQRQHIGRHSNNNKHYASSSFSSSDESCESEAPHQKLTRQQRRVPTEHSVYISNDALSLDGLLDSVSCGSFSSPPSPTYHNTPPCIYNHSSRYESLDKYNIDLDSLHITNNTFFLPFPLATNPQMPKSSLVNRFDNQISERTSSNDNNKFEKAASTNKSRLPSEIRRNMSSDCAHQLTKVNSANKSTETLNGTATDEASKRTYYMEKQKQLSDWYYIKTNKDIAVNDCGREEATTLAQLSVNSASTQATDAVDELSLQEEHSYVNCTRRTHATATIKPSNSGECNTFALMTRRAAMGSVRYATGRSQELQHQQPTKSYNSAHRRPQAKQISKNGSLSDTRRYNAMRAPLDDSDAEYSDAADDINRSSAVAKSCIKPYCPPYYCPPNYANSHQTVEAKEPLVGLPNALSAENVGLGNVSVRLLKQHYQQQSQQSQRVTSAQTPANTAPTTQTSGTPAEYTNMSFHKRTAAGKRSKNKIEMQLEHWENIVSNKSGSGDVAVKCRTTTKDLGSQAAQKTAAADEDCSFNQQQQQQNVSRCCYNNTNSVFVSTTSGYNNTRISGISDNVNKYSNNGVNILSENHEQRQSSLLETHSNAQLGQYSTHELSTVDSAQAKPQAASTCHPDDTSTAAATPKAALRSRSIQKRSDETSCSSFEQLNIISISTDENEDDAGTKNTSTKVPHLMRRLEQHFSAEDVRVCVPQSSMQHSETHLTGPGITTNEKSCLEVLRPVANRPLPNIPKQYQEQEQQKTQPHSRQLFGLVTDTEMFVPKTTSSCRSDCDLSGSYASLECPSPPGPPVVLPESRRDPLARLVTYFRTLYTDLSLKEPIIPQWAIPVAPGALCPVRLEPELKLNSSSHGFCDNLTIDQVLTTFQTKEGNFIDAPRRCLIECPAWTSRTNLCLRILHAWAKDPPWPAKGTPVALALFIPLAEVKRTFAHYIEKELLTKGPSNPFSNGIGGFSAAWNSLDALGPKLLLILDGYERQKLGQLAQGGSTPKKGKSGAALVGVGNKHYYPSDVHELLEGKIFPEARVIITTSTTSCTELLSIIQRHIIYEGLTWGRSVSLLGDGQWGVPSKLLDVIKRNVFLRKTVRTPLGCLAVAAIYESSCGNLPTDELDIIEAVLNCVSPECSATHIAELGRLALFCLKMRRPCFTIAEMRMYCSALETPLQGCLERNLLLGKSAKKKSEYIYHPICSGMLEYLAANYIASLANRPGLLAAEITGMAVGDELDTDLLKVLQFAMILLGDRAHILLSRLTPLWLTPQIVFTLALAGGPAEDNMAALCDILGISKHPPISPLETKPLWVQVRSLPTDLMGWGMALKSSSCTLKNLEVVYQLEKHNLQESRKGMEIFLDSLISNESVSTLRLSSLIEMDVKDSEISYLANCISKLLIKPRLENFELVLTLLEEDPPLLKLQPVLAALCRTIPRQPRLSFLLLDIALSTSQLVQLCVVLEKCPHVTRLSLPHLRCERGAITALASLLNSRPLSFLSLPSCWGARDDPPSSSGVSMGSGSGSSTGTSGIIKQGSLPGAPSPRAYAPGIFCSLPRGVYVPQSSLGRSATLPRQPLEQSLDKRSCDSVVSKTWYPTPACDGGPHNSGTLHDLLLAARDSYSKLHGLDLSKCQLSLEDSMCLGETVRLSSTLHTLKLEGSSRLSEVLPSIIGASESHCLQMLSIGSPRLSLEDSVIAMCTRALTNCSTLRLLSLDGWNFCVENSSTLSIVKAFLSLTAIRELSLANCRLQINFIKCDTRISQAFESRSVVVLKLSGAQATMADAAIVRGPQLLPYIGGFSCLRELDLSAPARSGLGSTHTTPLILDDRCIISFFQNLHSYFGLLNTLKICHWVIHFDELSKTLRTVSKSLRNSPISHLKIDGISVLDRPKKQRSEVNLIHCFIASLPQIRWMGISLAGKKEEQITAIGNAILDLKGYEIDIKLSESTIEHAKLMAQAISLDGKFDIKVSTFGTSSGILVHAEKSGTKSLTRKTKD